MAQKKNVHRGHRSKVRKRYIQTGFTGVAHHNVLEQLLFNAIAVKDTNPIAHELINKFGSFAEVLQADEDELFEVNHMTKNAACLLTMILPIHQRYKDRLFNAPTRLTTSKEIVAYMRANFDLSIPQVYALCFNFNHSLINCLSLSDKDFDEQDCDFRKLALSALQTKTASVVLVHTHFDGLAKPSKKDVDMTANAYNMLKNVQIRLQNHIIISKNKACSMADNVNFVYLFHDFDKL